MALSAKAAIFMCLAFIGGLSWVVQGFAPPPHMNRISPFARSEEAVTTLQRDVPSPLPLPVVQATREELVRQLARPSASLSAETALPNRGALALAPPQPPEPESLRLPPLAVTTDALALAPPEPTARAALPPGLPSAAEVILVAAGGSAGAPNSGLAETAIGAVPASDGAAAQTYQVVRGDSLTRIAAKHWNSRDQRLVELLRAANPQLKNRGGKLFVGERINLPAADEVQRVTSPGTGALAAAAASAAGLASAKMPRASAETAEQRWYTIQPRDSLTSIAQRYLEDGRRWPEIVAANRSLDPKKIRPGTRIRIPPPIRVAQR